MGRVQRIIEWATREARSKPECALSEKVYRDEPILITASQMRQFLPREYRDMRAIATSSEARLKPSTWVFAQQAKLMEDFEDDYPYSGEFVRYFPTYMAMSEDQLRGYFTWRAKMRRGEAIEGPTSFAFVYIYELLNGAGWDVPEEGFTLLKSFYEGYGAHDATVRRYSKRWMIDFVVWYGISPDHLGGLVQCGREEAIELLDGAATLDPAQMEFALDPRKGACRASLRPKRGNEEATAVGDSGVAQATVGERCASLGAFAHDTNDGTPWDTLFGAIIALSAYRIEASRLFKEHPNEFRRALCGTCAALAKHCAKHRKTSFSEGLFGAFREEDYVMLQNAVFYNDGRHPEASYALPDGRTFTCGGGRWRQRRRIAMNRGPKFGAIVKAVDACVRKELDMGAPLKAPELPKYMARIVTDEVRAAVAWEAAHKPFELKLDVSKLSGIRSAATETCEALLVDEEREMEANADVTFGDAAVGLEAHVPGCPEDFMRGELGDVSAALLDENASNAAHGFDSVLAAERFDDCFMGSDGHAVGANLADAGGENNECPLDGSERHWITALLENDSSAAHDALASTGLTDDLMADAVNEKLFDYLGDTAVESCGDGYAVVEDYRDDVEGLVR